MLFENSGVDISKIPSVSTIEWMRPAPGHLKQGLVQVALVFLALAAGVVIAWLELPLRFFGIALAGYVAGLSLSVLSVFKHHSLRGYALRQRDITVRSGWIFRTVTTVPFNRIQHVEIKEGAIERMFGIGTLQVFTAGGSSSDLSVPGLPADTAARLKAYISGAVAEESHGAPIDEEE